MRAAHSNLRVDRARLAGVEEPMLAGDQNMLAKTSVYGYRPEEIRWIKRAIFHDERQVSIGRHARHHSLLIVGTMPKLWLKPGFRRRALTHSAPP